MAPKSCNVCKHTEKQGIKIVRNCFKCKKSFHELCRPVFVLQSSPSNIRKTYICFTCKNTTPGPVVEEKTILEAALKKGERVPIVPLLSSTPVFPPNVKTSNNAKTNAKHDALKTTSIREGGIRTPPLFTSTTSNSDGKSSNIIVVNNNSSLDDGLSKEESDEIPSTVPRSKFTKITKTPARLAASLLDDPPNTSTSASTSILSASSGLSTTRLEASVVKNGSVISSLVTYANSIRDTVQEALTSHQGSLASSLGEIAASLSVLPKLTQEIAGLSSGVDSLETLLADRDSQLKATIAECKLLREQLGKHSERVLQLEEQVRCLIDVNKNNIGNNDSSKISNKSVNSITAGGIKIKDSDRPVFKGNDNNAAYCTLDGDIETNAIGFRTQYRRRRTRDPRAKGAGGSRRVSDSQGADGVRCGETEAEIIVSNVCDGTDAQRHEVVHAVLNTIDPSITKDDIVSIRMLRSESDSGFRRYPWVISLSRRDKVGFIMRAKSRLAAFSTKDINVSLLSEETRNCLITSKIFINELLSKDDFIRFNNLKRIARGLDFIYGIEAGVSLSRGETVVRHMSSPRLRTCMLWLHPTA